jgi:hypothetical protein
VSTIDSNFSCANHAIPPMTRNFTFVGTNAYWLPYLNSDDDIRNTLANMSKTGISVVRTWAFNGTDNHPVSVSSFLTVWSNRRQHSS